MHRNVGTKCLMVLTFRNDVNCCALEIIFKSWHTLPTAEILSGKNARAWVSMVLYLKKNKLKLKY